MSLSLDVYWHIKLKSPFFWLRHLILAYIYGMTVVIGSSVIEKLSVSDIIKETVYF